MTDQRTATPAATTPTSAAAPEGAEGAAEAAQVADPSRRQFFRRFAGEVATSAAQLVGVAAEVRDRSAAQAAVLLGDPAGADATVPGASAGTSPTGFRTPFRFESDTVLLLIDQRALPDALVEAPVRSASG
jgi:hypothetical protein